VEKLYQRTALNQLIAGSLVFIGVWANLHNVTDLLPEEYVGIYWVVVVVGLAKLINMATGVNGHIIMNSRFYRYDLYTNILLLVLTIGTNLLLIPVYGIVGAALATAISIFVYNFVKFIIVWVKFDMQPFQWNAGAIVGIAAVCLYISEQIPYMINFFVDVTVRSLIILLLFTSAVILFRLSEDFQNLALESLKRLKIFRTQN
jgi:O-antigen/teichoic acid export membrane protein